MGFDPVQMQSMSDLPKSQVTFKLSPGLTLDGEEEPLLKKGQAGVGEGTGGRVGVGDGTASTLKLDAGVWQFTLTPNEVHLALLNNPHTCW
jgi:hypothetical protein